MDNLNNRDLSNYRMERSEENLKASKLLLDNGLFKDSLGRSYYAMFSATRAILALDAVDFSKHAGVISYFQKEYVKTGKVDIKYSKYLMNAFQIRNHADYADYYIVTKEDAKKQYERAKEFCEFVRKLLQGMPI
ncbi:MAG: HEPN domain-containing protein [Ruminococcus sp.]|nr:HEPN domain-containing protein [Ruminococcus sp.]